MEQQAELIRAVVSLRQLIAAQVQGLYPQPVHDRAQLTEARLQGAQEVLIAALEVREVYLAAPVAQEVYHEAQVVPADHQGEVVPQDPAARVQAQEAEDDSFINNDKQT